MDMLLSSFERFSNDVMAMASTEMAMLGLIFASVALGVIGISGLTAKGPRRRSAVVPVVGTGTASVRYSVGGGLLGRLRGQITPEDAREGQRLRRQLMRAGYFNPNAVSTYYAIRVVLAAGLPLIFIVLLPMFIGSLGPERALMIGVGLVGAGLYLPTFVVVSRVQERAKRIREGFPDALDLMLVCVEAGLGLDAAIQRVGEEIARAHPLIAEQFTMMGLELRAGRTREEALQNLADRIGLDEVSAFVSLLIQSSQLGTSIGDALRVYADEMRHARLMRAEEKAYQLPVKIAVPLVLFLLPALMIAVMWPAIIQIARTLMPTMAGV